MAEEKSIDDQIAAIELEEQADRKRLADKAKLLKIARHALKKRMTSALNGEENKEFVIVAYPNEEHADGFIAIRRPEPALYSALKNSEMSAPEVEEFVSRVCVEPDLETLQKIFFKYSALTDHLLGEAIKLVGVHFGEKGKK